MLFFQMPNLYQRHVLHIGSQPEVDLAPGRHASLATEDISNERRATTFLCTQEAVRTLAHNFGKVTNLWFLAAHLHALSELPIIAQVGASPFSQSGQSDT